MATRFAADVWSGRYGPFKPSGATSAPGSGEYSGADYMSAIGGNSLFRPRMKGERQVVRTKRGETMSPETHDRMRADLDNALYKKVADDLKITNFNSANDMAQVIKRVSNRPQEQKDGDGRSGKEKSKPGSQRSAHPTDRVTAQSNLFQF